MATGSPLDLAQSVDIATLEAASPVFKLPKSALWVPGMEYIPLLFSLDTASGSCLQALTRTFMKSVHIKLAHKRRYVSMLKVLSMLCKLGMKVAG